VENRPGGGTNIDASAGGYTLLLAGAVNAVNATLYEKLNFDFIRDIAPGATGSSPGRSWSDESSSRFSVVPQHGRSRRRGR
jgi:hypothetical protein